MVDKGEAIEILLQKAVIHLDAPVELASGKMSSTFVDVKAGLGHADDLRTVCAAMVAQLADEGIGFDMVGGPTMGADHLAVGMALEANSSWFFVRKEPKGRGTGRQIEGSALGPESNVVVVEDAVSTGGSMIKAIEVIEATGATIVAVTTPIDRGDTAARALRERGLKYLPLATYRDLGLDPI